MLYPSTLRPGVLEMLPIEPGVDGERAIETFDGLPSDFEQVSLSPEEDRIVYVSGITGRLGVYVDSSPDVGAPRQISDRDGGTDPVWSQDGQAIYYQRDTDGAMMQVQISSTLDFLPPAIVFPNRDYGGNRGGWSLAPDGRFLMIKDLPAGTVDDASDLSETHDAIVVVKHWDQELMRRLPPD